MMVKFFVEVFMKRERGTFRNLAKSAKERMSGNFWHDIKGAQIAEVQKASAVGRSGGEVMQSFLACVKSKVIRAQELDPAEEQLYFRVREILCKDDGGNPLAAVLDRDLMRKLGEAERERYVFGLSEKVKACIQRFEQERTFASVVWG
jgi:hypothetical protein